MKGDYRVDLGEVEVKGVSPSQSENNYGASSESDEDPNDYNNDDLETVEEADGKKGNERRGPYKLSKLADDARGVLKLELKPQSSNCISPPNSISISTPLHSTPLQSTPLTHGHSRIHSTLRSLPSNRRLAIDAAVAKFIESVGDLRTHALRSFRSVLCHR